MSDALDVGAALQGGLRDRHHAWEFIRAFTAAWTGRGVQDADGVSEAELSTAEDELGVRLPVAVREGYALLGRSLALTCVQDPLVPATGLFVLDGNLIFRRENQGCAFWGIPLDQIDLDDPPVVVQTHDGWMPFLDRMSTAWVELVLSESMFAGDGPDALYDACELPDALLPTLQQRYTRVDLPDHPMWASADDSPLRWYAAPGRLLRHDGTQDHSWLHARGHTVADLEDIRNDLPGGWVR
ncbi:MULTISPECIES: hypothetical protein [Streptacidiphilus]|uniref:SMI1/KNR4 family protein n=1 Tax=Streptacidiphilus cavernicola TaxID=3342716 RepID=A0ABV6UZG2_9ACTN|nr:hypothetical protein [Streptacidiphilus jeojiense]